MRLLDHCCSTLRFNKKIVIALICSCLGFNIIYLLSYKSSRLQIPANFLKDSGIKTFLGSSSDTSTEGKSDSKISLGITNESVRTLQSISQTKTIPPKKNESRTSKSTEKPKKKILEKSENVPIREPGDSKLPFEDRSIQQVFNISIDIHKEKSPGFDPPDPYNPPLKKILFWNEAYGEKNFGFGFGQEPFRRAGCRVNTCMTTGNKLRFRMEEIDAIVWHFRSNDQSLPDKRSPHTRYVFWMMESASHLYGDITQFNNEFNWTFTYKLDSDFPNPYGIVYRRRDPVPLLILDTTKKTKLAAWFVSNCFTIGGRTILVETLKKWINIDVYGDCGPLKCDRQHQWDTCYKMLERDYKFYFSFENSLCQDYATEKFFSILKLSVVPVVYGLGRYHLQAPPHSYINALDFPSAKALAEYLLYLDKNQTAYHEYFQWKRFHYQPNEWERVAKPWCQLCERLHTDNTTKVYDLHKWFVADSNCKDSNSIEISRLIRG